MEHSTQASVGAKERDPLTYAIIGAALTVSRSLGPGLLESVYDEVFAFELSKLGLDVARQVPVPVVHEGVRLNVGFRPDFIIARSVIVEVKTVERLLPVHEAQLLTYLRLSGLHKGLLINFHAFPLLQGIKRMVM
jgi:GxxExxY protein